MVSWQSFKSLHLKLLDIDHPLTFKESKLRQIEAHALIYLTYLTIGHTPLSSGGFATSRLCAFAFKGHVLGVEGREGGRLELDVRVEVRRTEGRPPPFS